MVWTTRKKLKLTAVSGRANTATAQRWDIIVTRRVNISGGRGSEHGCTDRRHGATEEGGPTVSGHLDCVPGWRLWGGEWASGRPQL